MDNITYRKVRKIKYQLRKPYSCELPREYAKQVKKERNGGWVRLTVDGTLHFNNGYAWDGPSGPTIDTKTFMRGSLVHDGMYQLLRAGLFDRHGHWREIADNLIRILCLEDGMMRIRAWYTYKTLRLFGGKAAREDPYAEPPTLTAP